MILNRSFTYALPMLDWWDSRKLVNSQLRGVFIGDVNYPEFDEHILLLYQFIGDRWFTMFEQTLKDCDEYVTSYDIDKRHMMFVYDVPEHHKFNYKMFRESKYSKFEDSFKQQIISFHRIDNTSKVSAVLYKHESMFREWENKINEGLPHTQHTKIPRNQEATDILHMEVEVYNDKLLPKSGALIAPNDNFFNMGGRL